MKLYYDKRLKDPTYYGQQGFRNGKKVTSKNVKNFGKHSELLKITDDPLSYVKEEIRKMNEEYRVGRVSFDLTADFNEKVRSSDGEASGVQQLNKGKIATGRIKPVFFCQILQIYCCMCCMFMVYLRVEEGML